MAVVAYADWERAKSVPPAEMVKFAKRFRYRAFLFDTYQEVTPKDIQDAAKKYFREEGRTVVTLATQGQKLASAEGARGVILRGDQAPGHRQYPPSERVVLARDVESTHAWLEPRLRARDAAAWEEHFRMHEVPAAEALAPSAAYDLAKRHAARWPEVRLTNADGRSVRVPGPGFGSSEALTPALSAPPLRGQHTSEVLREVGMDPGTIEAMLARGAARQPASTEREAK